LIVIVEFPEPELILAGLKLTVTPDGAPEADKETAELNPPEGVAVIVDVPDLPQVTLSEVGEALRLKLPPLAAAVTVRDTVVVCVTPPPVPVTVTGYVPVSVDEATANVIVDVPDPGAAIEVGLKVTVTPLGWPEAVKAIAELNPPDTEAVIVDVPLFPCTTETEPGEAERLKLGDEDVSARALSKPAPLGLPQPVTKSYPGTAG
jgi:hypothetical protein